jgi:hypothetical protein
LKKAPDAHCQKTVVPPRASEPLAHCEKPAV